MSYGHYMGYNLSVQYRSKVSNTVSTVDTSMSYGSSIVKLIMYVLINFFYFITTFVFENFIGTYSLPSLTRLAFAAM